MIVHMFFFLSPEFLSKADSVTLEPSPTPYNSTRDYQKMYSGNPYVFGLDPVRLF